MNIPADGSAKAAAPAKGGKDDDDPPFSGERVGTTMGLGPKFGNTQVTLPGNPGTANEAVVHQRHAYSNSGIVFDLNSATLKPEDRVELDEWASAFKQNSASGRHFRIEGHTDESGTPDVNAALSLERARAVVDYLVNDKGVPADRLVPVGVGSTDLADPNHPLAPANRRVVVSEQ